MDEPERTVEEKQTPVRLAGGDIVLLRRCVMKDNHSVGDTVIPYAVCVMTNKSIINYCSGFECGRVFETIYGMVCVILGDVFIIITVYVR